MNKEQLRNSAIKYIKEIYRSHREQDVEVWDALIQVLLDYVDESIKYYHGDETDDTTKQ